MMDHLRLQELEIMLTNHTPTPEQVVFIEQIREGGKAFGELVISGCPDSRSRSLALTHLEDCVMRAVQAIVLEGRLPSRM